MIKLKLGVGALVFATNIGYAGAVALTYHSRANCVGFNESISWHLGHEYNLYTYSQHYQYSNYGSLLQGHDTFDNWHLTWRSAAYHTNEGYGGWKVWGVHKMIVNGLQKTVATTFATNCNIYNGWWD